MSRRVRWFSCGAASAVATRLDMREHPEGGVIGYCETGSEDPDNERFMADCIRWWNAPVDRIKSPIYDDTWAVWEDRKYLAGIDGAPCTFELKVAPRLFYQRADDIHVFGYTADGPDITRAKRMRENYPEMAIATPLIDAGINKAACLALLMDAGIAPPRTYAEGFPNANCIPCVKATSPDYWSLVRLRRPEHFARMVELSRRLGVRLARINDERVFIDDIPADWPVTNPIAPACDFLCHIAGQDLAA